jgi:fumarate reductase flavoprotein subunit
MLAVAGGLLVNTRLQVEDKDQNPIPGLYAVGNVAGGLYGVDYPTIIPGNSHGRAVAWGYLAGSNAVEDL